MNKTTGFVIAGTLLSMILVYFFYTVNESPQPRNVPVVEKQLDGSQVTDKEKQISPENNAANDLRNALQGVVQDSIDADVQEAVQSEVAKSQK